VTGSPVGYPGGVRRALLALTVALAIAVPASIAVRAQNGAAPALAADPGPAPGRPPAPVQPIPYSHRQHLALGLQCEQCHANPDGGELMTFPPVAICMGCHQAIAADRPSIQKLAAFAAAGTPVPWARVYQMPDYVFWSHGAHLRAKVTCAECHGDVASLEVMSQQTDVVTMLGCRRCHDQRQAFTDCIDCHEPLQ
jgi:hypothetical protein